jgi:hypothetical protein
MYLLLIFWTNNRISNRDTTNDKKKLTNQYREEYKYKQIPHWKKRRGWNEVWLSSLYVYMKIE